MVGRLAALAVGGNPPVRDRYGGPERRPGDARGPRLAWRGETGARRRTAPLPP